jgi:hypothetical protein
VVRESVSAAGISIMPSREIKFPGQHYALLVTDEVFDRALPFIGVLSPEEAPSTTG